MSTCPTHSRAPSGTSRFPRPAPALSSTGSAAENQQLERRQSTTSRWLPFFFLTKKSEQNSFGWMV
eukprot:4082911-Pyramimonas_sp.AAC.1